MDAPGGAREPRFGSPYTMGLLSEVPDMYGAGRPPSSLGGGGTLRPGMQPCNVQRTQGVKRPSDQCYDDRPSPSIGLEHCPMPDMPDDSYGMLQPKKSPPSNGKKTKGRVKIKMEYIDNKLRRYTTFSKRKTGIMKKAYELSTLTGTQVMLLVASETGHVYTFATRKLQPMITSDAGKRLIQTCLNSPDPPTTSEQRMAATGFEETELTYNVVDEDMKNLEESIRKQQEGIIEESVQKLEEFIKSSNSEEIVRKCNAGTNKMEESCEKRFKNIEESIKTSTNSRRIMQKCKTDKSKTQEFCEKCSEKLEESIETSNSDSTKQKCERFTSKTQEFCDNCFKILEASLKTNNFLKIKRKRQTDTCETVDACNKSLKSNEKLIKSIPSEGNKKQKKEKTLKMKACKRKEKFHEVHFKKVIEEKCNKEDKLTDKRLISENPIKNIDSKKISEECEASTSIPEEVDEAYLKNLEEISVKSRESPHSSEEELYELHFKEEPTSSGESGDESGSEPESPSDKLNHQGLKQEWTMDHCDREPTKSREPQASTSSIIQEPDSSKPIQGKSLPKLELPGGAMLYHPSVLASVGLENLGSNLGLGNLAMGYPPGFILGLANQGQDGASSSTQPQFITIPLPMAMAAAASNKGSSANGGLISASSDDSSELQDLSVGGRK